MKEKIYLRIAKASPIRYLYKADKKKKHTPLDNGHYIKTYLPTIIVDLNLDIPNEMFEKAQAE